MARTTETKEGTESGAETTGGRGEAAVPAAPAPAAAPAASAAATASGTAQARSRRQQVKVGRVVSNKMEKTVIVTVENITTHHLYQRYMKRTSKFAAHDGENRCQVGDVVEIVSSRPISKSKRWRVREILKRAE